jgi:hypothetical protein
MADTNNLAPSNENTSAGSILGLVQQLSSATYSRDLLTSADQSQPVMASQLNRAYDEVMMLQRATGLASQGQGLADQVFFVESLSSLSLYCTLSCLSNKHTYSVYCSFMPVCTSVMRTRM